MRMFAGFALRLMALVFVAAAPGNVRADDSAKSLARSFNAFGQDLFNRLAAKQPGNLVFSPYSIGAAMAMVRSGARGDTETELAAVLKQGQTRAQIEQASGELMAVLSGYESKAAADAQAAAQRAAPPAGGLPERPASGPQSRDDRAVSAAVPPPLKLSIANALMLTGSDSAIAEAYADLVRRRYAAEIIPEADVATVNEWVRHRTEGKIDRIIEDIQKDVPAILLNAVYFKGAWQQPFSARATRPAPFRISAQEEIQVPTMRQSGRFAVVVAPTFHAIRLPYVNAALAMVLVVPSDVDRLRTAPAMFGADDLANLFASLNAAGQRSVSLSLPRLDTVSKLALGEPFRQLGMRLAFDRERADFAGMTGGRAALYIGEVLHRAVVKVTEEGTEAAAATAVAMIAGSALQPKRDLPFPVDRPFLFFITERSTGAILFQGRIMDPRSS
jgi:serpin B